MSGGGRIKTPAAQRVAKRRETPHYRLHRWLAETAAWKELNGSEKAIYADIGLRYRGPQSNNGKIPYSIREGATCARIGKTTAAKCLLRLQEFGFIFAVTRGDIDWKAGRSSEWRLTEFPCDVSGELATKEFARWRPGDSFLPARQPKNSKPRPPSGTGCTSTRTVVYPHADSDGANITRLPSSVPPGGQQSAVGVPPGGHSIVYQSEGQKNSDAGAGLSLASGLRALPQSAEASPLAVRTSSLRAT
jgi:hypothetical protein